MNKNRASTLFPVSPSTQNTFLGSLTPAVSKAPSWTWHLLMTPAVQAGAIISLGIVLRVARLHTWGLTDDEGLAIHAASLHFGELFRFIAARDAHPPLFYAALWAAFRAGLGGSELGIRLLPASFGIAAVCLMYVFAKRLFSHQVALVATAFLALSPFHVRWSQEARMFSLVALLSLCALYALICLKETNNVRYWLGYGVSIAAGLYADYSFGFVLLTYQLLAIWWWLGRRGPDVRRWFVCHAIVAILYIPWYLVARGKMASEALGVTLGGMGSFFWDIYMFTSGPLPMNTPLLKAIVIAVGVLGILGALLRVRGGSPAIQAVLAGALIPLLVGSILIVRDAPATVLPRLLIVALGPWLLLLAVGILRLGRPLRWATLLFLFAMNAYSYGRLVTEWPYTADWDHAAAHIARVGSPRSIVIGMPGYSAYVFDFYFRKQGVAIPTFAYWDRQDLIDLDRALEGKTEIWWSVHEYFKTSSPHISRYLEQHAALQSVTEYHHSDLRRYAKMPGLP